MRAPQVKDWFRRFDLLVAELDAASFGEVQAIGGVVRSKLDAIEARLLAGEVGADGDTRRARRMAGAGGKRSKRAARQAAERAKAVSKNPDLADKLASGNLSSEQVDTIASTLKSNEGAATNDELIDGVSRRSVDAGRKFAREWAARNSTNDAAETEHQRQQRLRRASRYKDHTKGLSVLTLEGADAAVEQLWNLIQQRERQLKAADGGRDLPAGDHPRTLDQRLFDAAVEVINGQGSSTGRPSIVIQIVVDGHRVTTAVPGLGPLAESVARELLANADLAVELVDRLTSRPLWYGRARRDPSLEQFLALVLRDGGCALCDAHWTRCEVHHRIPWNAPAAGATDINDLVLMCIDCHQHIHNAHLTLEHDAQTGWTTRPAQPHEVPCVPRRGSSRPPTTRRAAGRAEPKANSPDPPTSGAAPSDNPTRSADQDNPRLFRQPAHQRSRGGDDTKRDADADHVARPSKPAA